MKAQKAYSVSGIILFLLSLVYLCAELIFNRQLLDVSSSVRSDPDQVEHIQYFGRAASGLGFSLLVQGIFQHFGFRIRGKRQWAVFAVVTLICLLPFITALGQTAFEKMAGDDVPYTEGMAWGFLPFAGVCFVLAGRGQKPFAVVLGLVVMTWPAMFYGQKLAVERFIISPTTAEDRLNAHYILLLRSGIEDCIISMEGTQFCDGDTPDEVEKRSTRAVLGALFMLNTKAVFDGLSFSKDQIIDSISAQDMWFSSREYYQKYLQQVADKRAQYEDFIDETYYQPYLKASDLYLKTYSSAKKFYEAASRPGRFEGIAQDAAVQVSSMIDAGWQKYRNALSTYNSLTASVASSVERDIYNRLCRGHEDLCNNFASKSHNGISVDGAMSQLRAEAEEKFYEKTGYPPDIRTREDFISNQKTQDEVRAHVEEKMQEQIEGYMLPVGWIYDPATFKNDVLRMLEEEGQNKALEIAARAQQEWKDKVQSRFNTSIQPGLSRDEFFKRLGGDPLPPLKDLVMSEADFRKKYIVPVNRKIADETLKSIEDEEPSYANRQQLAEQAKDYIRVLYIPAIALCLSIMIVIITIGRYLTLLAAEITLRAPPFKKLTPRGRSFVRPVYWILFAAGALMLPYHWPNDYISTKAYQKYYHLARDKSPVTAQLLDWVVHVQPIIYRAGAYMPEVNYMQKQAPQQDSD